MLGWRLLSRTRRLSCRLRRRGRPVARGNRSRSNPHPPQYIMPPDAEPLAVWDVDPTADNTIVGGHAVVLAGYDANGARVISWGKYYTMTWAFFAKFVDEAYAITDPEWTKVKTTPGGLTVEELEQAMKSLKAN